MRRTYNPNNICKVVKIYNSQAQSPISRQQASNFPGSILANNNTYFKFKKIIFILLPYEDKSRGY
jgi:hypothetical protein